MPELDDYLHYRSIDVSSLKELCRRWYPAIYRKRPGKAEHHRALDDIRESIEELRFYRDNLLRLPDDRDRETAARPSAQSELAEGAEQRGDRVLARAVAHEADAPALAREVAEAAADLDVEAAEQLAAHLGVVDTSGSHTDVSCGRRRSSANEPEAELGQRVLQQRADLPRAAPTTPRALRRAAHRGPACSA